jgi:hypothetical protein
MIQANYYHQNNHRQTPTQNHLGENNHNERLEDP